MNDRMQSSPFAHNDQNVRKVMMQVQIAALPALLVHLYFFGFGIVVQWLLAVLTLIAVESAMLKLRGRPILPYLTDLSGLITITGLVFCIPPTAPWWIIVTGSTFALIFGKHLYGGLGYNPFNPAMLGYAFLLISFPVPMTQWILPAELSGHYIGFAEALQLIFQGHMNGTFVDMMTGATPLNESAYRYFSGNQRRRNPKPSHSDTHQLYPPPVRLQQLGMDQYHLYDWRHVDAVQPHDSLAVSGRFSRLSGADGMDFSQHRPEYLPSGRFCTANRRNHAGRFLYHYRSGYCQHHPDRTFYLRLWNRRPGVCHS